MGPDRASCGAEKYLYLLRDGRVIVLPASERFWVRRRKNEPMGEYQDRFPKKI